jgi:hypothetical protein
MTRKKRAMTGSIMETITMIKQLNLTAESYGISKFFFYQVLGEMEIDSESVEYLSKHKPAGLLPFAVLKKDEDIYIRYDQISDFTLERLFSGKLTKQHLASYLINLIDSLEDLKDHLDLQNILLNKKFIFLDHFSNRLVFIYAPIKDNVFEKGSMKAFFRDLVSTAPYDEDDDLSFFVSLHNDLVSDEEIDLLQFKEKLVGLAGRREVEVEENMSKAVDEAVSHFYSPGKMTSEVSTSIDNGVLTSEYSSKKVDKKTGQKLEIEEEVQYKRITRTELGEGDSLLKGTSSIGGTSINIVPNYHATAIEEENEGTTVLGVHLVSLQEEEGTTVLGVGGQQPYLLAVKNEEKITVTKDRFTLGRDPEQADYASKNMAVGRVHAEVVNEDGEYFLVDLESRNGSFVNGKKLAPKGKIKLKHEDKIKLANEEFIFKLF